MRLVEERAAQIGSVLGALAIIFQIVAGILASNTQSLQSQKDGIYLELITNYSALNRNLSELGNLGQEIRFLIQNRWTEQQVKQNPIYHSLSTQAQADWGEKTILELRYEQERQLIKSKQAVEIKVDQTEMSLSKEMRKINDHLKLNTRWQSFLNGLIIIILFMIIYLHGRITTSIASRIKKD